MTPPSDDLASLDPPRARLRRGPFADRVAVSVRYLALAGLLVAAAGAAGHWLALPLLASSIGPTAYMFVAHPDRETSQWRNALVGHAVGIGAGLAALASLGLWHHPSVSATGAPTWAQVAAAVLAAGATVMGLELIGSHHAPAAATALLVATGLARPGPSLTGLVLGLAVVLAAGPLVGRIPLARGAVTEEAASETAEARRA